jgi:ACS family D-galactonate transporter-like MFS transporter
MQRSKIRFGVLTLISIGTVINYLAPAVLGVAAPALTKELGFSAAVMGVVFSAFSWTYAAAQIPGGVLLDRLGTRIVYFLSVSLWSTFTLLQGFISGLAGLMACRLGLGTAEAPCFPANSRVLGTWFPQHERARANSVYAVGQYFGLAFMSPLLFWIVSRFAGVCCLS